MDPEDLVLSRYARLDLYAEGEIRPVYVKFCDRCFALVAAVKMPAHMEAHHRSGVQR